MTNNPGGDQQLNGGGPDGHGPDGLDELDGLTYGAALDELEELLDELEGADIDVDRLAERVARGAELVRFCRARLDVVSKDVEQVVTELISTDDLAGTASSSGTVSSSDEETEAPTR